MNIEIKKITELKEIIELFFHPDIHHGFVPDKSISKNKFKKFINSDFAERYNFYILICDSIPIGLSILYKMTINCVMLHIGILKKFRGKIAYKVMQQLSNMISKKLNYKKIVAPINATNKAAIYVVKRFGFQFFGNSKDQLIWEKNYG